MYTTIKETIKEIIKDTIIETTIETEIIKEPALHYEHFFPGRTRTSPIFVGGLALLVNGLATLPACTDSKDTRSSVYAPFGGTGAAGATYVNVKKEREPKTKVLAATFDDTYKRPLDHPLDPAVQAIIDQATRNSRSYARQEEKGKEGIGGIVAAVVENPTTRDFLQRGETFVKKGDADNLARGAEKEGSSILHYLVQGGSVGGATSGGIFFWRRRKKKADSTPPDSSL